MVPRMAPSRWNRQPRLLASVEPEALFFIATKPVANGLRPHFSIPIERDAGPTPITHGKELGATNDNSKNDREIDRGVPHNRPIQANDRDVVMRYEEALLLTHSHHFFSIHDTHIQLTDYALFSATI